MEDEQWREFVDALVDAKRSLSNAWAILDGTDGAATGSEPALTAALAGIDALFGIESSHEANMDVATPAEVQEFWDAHSGFRRRNLGASRRLPLRIEASPMRTAVAFEG